MAEPFHKAGLWAPSEIMWQGQVRGMYPMAHGTASVGFCWRTLSSNTDVFDFQFRYRSRLGYAKYMEGSDDLWSAWTAWQGSDATTVDGCYVVEPVQVGGEWYTTAPVSLAVDADHVCYEVEARMRPLGSHWTNGTLDGIFAYGDWTPVQALAASWRPYATALGAVEQADGSLLVTCNTDWGESGNSVALAQVYGTGLQAVGADAPGDDDGFTLSIPAGAWESLSGYALIGFRTRTAWGLRWDFSGFGSLSDGVFRMPNGHTVIASFDDSLDYAAPKIGRRVESDAITAELSAAPYGTGMRLSITANEELDYAHAVATWEDALGNRGRSDVAMSGSGKSWTADFPAVPFGVPVAFEARLGASDEFAMFAETVTLDSEFASFLADDGTEFRLMWNPEASGSWSPDADAVKTLGGDLPISRYGRGGEGKVTVKGIMTADDGSGWKRELETLRDGHDWTLRLPDGEVRRVMVTSYSISTSNDTGNIVGDVSITCEEVLDA